MRRIRVVPFAPVAGFRRAISAPSRAALFTVALSLALLTVGVSVASAASSLAPRFSRNARGDIAVIANTVMTCPASQACTDAQNGAAANNNAFQMAFVDIDSDAATFNSSSADLSLPAESEVLFAGLYWGGDLAPGSGGPAPNAADFKRALLKTPGGGAYLPVVSSLTDPQPTDEYVSFVDVTALVKAAGNGTYTVANVQGARGINRYAGWSIVVAYQLDTLPLRRLLITDGNVFAYGSTTATVNVPGLLTPASGVVTGEVILVAYEGDRDALPGKRETVSLNGQVIGDSLNPTTNLFNSSITRRGARFSAKNPDYTNQLGFDADILSIDGVIPNNTTSVTLQVISEDDRVTTQVLAFVIDLLAPDLRIDKTAADLTGGAPLRPGDQVEYTITVRNAGGDTATNAVMIDKIPSGTTYVPGSLRIVSGANAGTKTDALDGDQAHFDTAKQQIEVHVGAGANSSAGGTLNVNEESVIAFRVQVAGGAANGAVIDNIGTASAVGGASGSRVDVQRTASLTVVNEADLRVSKSASNATPSPGDTLTYTIEVTNNGPSAVTGATLTDVFPSALTGVTWTCSGTGGATCAAPSGTGAILKTVSVPVGGRVTVTATGKVDAIAIGTVTNTATVAPPTGVSLLTPSSATASATVTVQPSPSIGLAKRVTSVVDNGDGSFMVTFELTVGNYGNQNLTSILLSDNLGVALPSPATFTPEASLFVGGSGVGRNPGFDGRTDTRVAFINRLDVDTSRAIRFGIRIRPNGGPTSYLNSATVTAQAPGSAEVSDRSTNGADPDPNEDSRPAENRETPVSLSVNADVAVASIVATPTPALVGEDLTYTVTVTNNGPSQAANVTLVQTFGTAVTFGSATGPSATCTGNSTTVNCALGALNSGDSRVLTIVVRPTTTGTLSATAVASTTTTDTFPDNNQRQLDVPVQPSADVSLTKSVAPTTPLVGQTITSTLTVTNNGPSPATNVVVTDQVLGAARFVSATPGSCTESLGVVTCNVGTLAVGSSSVITTTYTVEAVGVITDIGAATANEFDPDPTNNGRTVSVAATASADLALTKTPSAANVLVGQQITYTLTVQNNGPSPATDVILTDSLPARTDLVSLVTSQGTCAGTTAISCTLGTLANGGTATVTVTVQAKSAGTLGNLASVSSSATDPNPANNSASAVTAADGVADMSITLTPSSASVPVGSTVTFTAIVQNAGPQAGTLTQTRIALPAATGLSVTTSAGVCSVTDIVVDCDLGTVAVGGSVTITIQAVAGTPGILNAGGAVRAFETDPNAANNVALASVTVGTVSGAPVDLQVTKTGPASVNGGSNVTYTVTITNASVNGASNVVVDDVLPDGFVLVSSTPSQGACTTTQPSPLQCALGAIAGGGNATITIVARADAAGVQVNTATVTSNEPDTNSANNIAQATTSVTGNADLSVTIVPNAATVAVGDQTTLTITVANGGPTGAADVELTSLLAGVPFDVSSVNPTQGTCSTSSPISCQLGAIANGGTATITVVGRPRAAGGLDASVSVTSGTVDPNPSNNTATTGVTVTASADLAVTLTATPDPLPVTSALTYTAVVTNNGPSASSQSVLLLGVDRVATLVSVSSTRGTCRLVSGLLLCDLGALAVGQTATVTLVVRPNELGALVGGAAVIGAELDPNLANNSAVASIGVELAASGGGDLRLTKTASTATPEYGGEVQFQLTVRNQSATTATGVVLTDPLPAELQFVSATASQGSCTGGQTLICNLGTIPGNGQVTIDVVTRAVGSGRITNTASVLPSGIDGNPADNVASASVDIGGTTIKPNNDDENDKPKETEEERRQREQTNRGGLDDDRTEGNVVAVRCADGAVTDSVGWMDDGQDAPYAVIVNRDGLQKVRLIGEAKTTCRSIKVGQYLEADGVKQTEQLFDAENVKVR